MQAMKDFCMWFLSELPDFLMSEPIVYFVGAGFLFVVIQLVKNIITIHR